ncbi:hypothetical protein [Flavobacterium covae]|uniref:hypothetical protein n=1 Tax=Flavobacterium covae TaxID=2906076 RepID=UPI000745CB92|nr:hypothetical protein [Flavobacterium covae]AMA49470.1 hypothetical protein AWN65_08355 [Flavobacterium covae]MCJ1808923.1 hypothetical protein [Flavobacterium covae]
MQIEDIYNQNLKLSNNHWKIELYYEHEFSEKKSEDVIENPIYINDFESGTFLKIICFDSINNKKTYFLTGIDGGFYLRESDEISKSFIIKLENQNLIMSLGFTFLSFNCETGKLNWKIRSDTAEIFEFYEIENDYLIRGELAIHRINKNGEIIWSYGGRDIWVNVNGKEEVKNNSDNIHLIDFENNEYIIDYNGETLKDIPKTNRNQIRLKKWWEFWA